MFNGILQNRVFTTLVNKINQVKTCIAEKLHLSRNAISKKVCEDFNLKSPNGKPQISACNKALNKLENKGLISLPVQQYSSSSNKIHKANAEISDFITNKCCNSLYDDIYLELVNNSENRELWHTVVKEELSSSFYPVGNTLLYLIKCSGQIAGVIGFYSASINMDCRDKFIGWTVSERQSMLHYVVRMNPFCLRRHVDATKVMPVILNKIPSQLKNDFLQKYGIEIKIIETYTIQLNLEKYFLNKKWQFLEYSSKNINNTNNSIDNNYVSFLYLYDGNNIWKEFNLSDVGQSPLQLQKYIDTNNWVNDEFLDLNFGDKRRNSVFIELLKLKLANPTANFSELIDEKSAFSQRVYRFLKYCDKLYSEDEKSLECLNTAGLPQLIRRIRSLDVVIHATDGVRINYSNKIKCNDLGIIAAKCSTSSTLGLHGHYTYSMTLDGVPIGIVRSDFKAFTKREKGVKVADTEKKSQLWFDHADAVIDVAKKTPETKHIYTSDRESDILGLFAKMYHNQNVFFVIRGEYDRADLNGNKIYDKLAKAKPLGKFMLSIEHKSERKCVSASPKRKVLMNIYTSFHKVKLPQSLRKIYNMDSIVLNYVYACEEKQYEQKLDETNQCQEITVYDTIDEEIDEVNLYAENQDVQNIEDEKTNEKSLEWLIVTNLPVNSYDEAMFTIRVYKNRWKIEESNRICKTSCGIEKLRNHSANKLRVLGKIILIVSWWVAMFNAFSRVHGEILAKDICDESKIIVINVYAKNNDLPTIKTFNDYVRTVAKIGGYLGRKHDRPPGNEILSRGLCKLNQFLIGFKMAIEEILINDNPELIKTYSRGFKMTV